MSKYVKVILMLAILVGFGAMTANTASAQFGCFGDIQDFENYCGRAWRHALINARGSNVRTNGNVLLVDIESRWGRPISSSQITIYCCVGHPIIRASLMSSWMRVMK